MFELNKFFFLLRLFLFIFSIKKEERYLFSIKKEERYLFSLINFSLVFQKKHLEKID